MNAGRHSTSTKQIGAIPSIGASLKAVPYRTPLQLVKTQGQVHIHTSSYRGSFSVVLSEALRSAGLGSRVLIAQFLRGGVNQGAEGAIHLCGRLEWLRPSIECCLPDNSSANDLSLQKKSHQKAIKEIWEICKMRLEKNTIDKMVLDEIGLAISLGFIEEADVVSTINSRPSSTDIILTGPSIPTPVSEMADQITELRCS